MIKINDGTDYFELIRRIDAEHIMFADQAAMKGPADRRYVVLRHDVDRCIENGLKLAEAEHRAGLRSTFFLLHTQGYFDYSAALKNICRDIVKMGHHIGLHLDALGAWVQAHHLEQPAPDLRESLAVPLYFLRVECGIEVRGCSAHGNFLCGRYGFNNYHVFSDWPLPETNTLGHDRFPMSDFGLEWEVYHLHRDAAFSDSGGKWRGGMKNVPCPIAKGWGPKYLGTRESHPRVVDVIIKLFNCMPAGVLHVLIHPNWWRYD